jgi:hypothetical protein
VAGAIGRDEWFTERLLDEVRPALTLEERAGSLYTPWVTLVSGFIVWRSSPEAGPETSLEVRIAADDVRLPVEQMISRTVGFILGRWRYEVTGRVAPVFAPAEWHLRGYRVGYVG